MIMTDTEKLEAAAMYLFPDWDGWPSDMRVGVRERLYHILTWADRLVKAEKELERLTNEHFRTEGRVHP